MKIEELVLFKNTRLKLGGKEKVVYRPDSAFQLIIGTNSSGKSTMIYELSPLPPNFNDYEVGGYKEIKIFLDNSRFHIKSVNGSHKSHSFIKDGKELNPGGTITVQRELVNTYFGITQDIHDLLTDTVKFTDMSVAERRKIITTFHPLDLAYAFKIFNNVKTQLRDTVGALKHNDSRTIQATEKLLELEASQEDYDSIIKDLNKRIDGLFSLRSEVRDRPTPNVLKETIAAYPKVAERLSKNQYPVPPMWLDGSEDENEVFRKIEYSYKRSEEEYADLLHRLSEINHLAERIASSEAQLVRIKKERTEILDAMKVIESKFMGRNIPEVSEDAKNLIGVIDNAIRVLTPLTLENNLQELVERIGSVDKAKRVLAAMEKATQRLSNTETNLTSIQELLEHARHSDDITCPKCDHSWNAAVGNVDELLLREQALIETLNTLHGWIDDNAQEVRLAEQFIYVGDQLRWVADSLHNKALSKLLTMEGLMSGEAIQKLQEETTLIHDSIEYHEMRKSAETYHEAICNAEMLFESSKQVADVDPNSLQRRLEEVKRYKDQQKQCLEELKKYFEKKDSYKAGLMALTDAGDSVDNSIMEIAKATFNEVGDYYISQYRSTLGVIQNRKTTMEVLRGNVESLKADKVELKANEEALKALLSTLSPTEGIIAEQLYGSIKSVVKDMNATIENIWTYDLIIQPCPMEDDELSYKFPFVIETPDCVRSDISKGSASVRDIINFSFKKLAYKHYKLKNYPLFLDEFGSTFDPEHLHRAMMYVQNEHSLGEHSTIFMVSHFENYYSNFADADINILHSDNIRFEHEFNRCLTIS